ncbi:MAG: hypothetical protein EOM40_11725 [Clostridia bacterium]|nr:hypothetical protein [Clostridia bacterium]NCC42762.1 hypothetical protein [Clostridia bacterium]
MGENKRNMRYIKRMGIWYFLLNKRFLKKYIFTLLLLLVPFLVLGMRVASKEDAGVLKVALYQENQGQKEEDSDGIVEQLLEKDGVIQYEKVDAQEEAYEAVRQGKADCAWIFPADIAEAVRKYMAGEAANVMTVYTKEDTIQNKLAREQLYGVLYPMVSYETVRQFIEKQPYFEDMDEDTIDLSMREMYAGMQVEESIFNFTYMDGTKSDASGGSDNYLTSPLRGLLAILILLCGMAVTMFYMQDEKEGIFIWMPVRHRRLFPWLYILVGTLDGAVCAYVALWVSGSFIGWKREFMLMILYMIAVTGFCNLLRVLGGNLWRVGASIPVIILVNLVLCPVFINIRSFPVIQYLLPGYYYLNSLHSDLMLGRMLLYVAVITAGSIGLDKIMKMELSVEQRV